MVGRENKLLYDMDETSALFILNTKPSCKIQQNIFAAAILLQIPCVYEASVGRSAKRSVGNVETIRSEESEVVAE